MTTTAAEPVHPAVTAVGGTGRVFVDTNVWVYAIAAAAPLHVAARTALAALRQSGVELWVSRQVLWEYAATMTRPQPFSTPQPGSVAVGDIGQIVALSQLAEDGPSVFTHFLSPLTSVQVGGRRVHDANIVATMLAHGVPNLLTHNTADFNRFTGHVTVVPLVPPPGGP